MEALYARSPTYEILDFPDNLALQARFRVYGAVFPVFPPDVHEEFDLAHVFSGGRVVFTSDQHFGVGSNLIIPGRGASIAAAYTVTVSPFTLWNTQGKIWAMAGKPNAVANQVTRIGPSSNCKSIFHNSATAS
jgi:hypothetical protein